MSRPLILDKTSGGIQELLKGGLLEIDGICSPRRPTVCLPDGDQPEQIAFLSDLTQMQNDIETLKTELLGAAAVSDSLQNTIYGEGTP